MKYILKAILNKLVRTFGFEVVRYTPQQRTLLRSKQKIRYRDFVIEEAMAPRGEISLSEAIFLSSLVRDLKDDGPIIEIGTLFGRSTLVMACQKSVERLLITVDNYSWNPLGISTDMHFRVTEKVLSEAVRKLNVKQLNLNKDDFYLAYNGDTPALVFLDAIHTYEETRADILWAKRVSASTICGHDYHREEHPEVVKAVQELGGPRKLVETLWVL